MAYQIFGFLSWFHYLHNPGKKNQVPNLILKLDLLHINFVMIMIIIYIFQLGFTNIQSKMVCQYQCILWEKKKYVTCTPQAKGVTTPQK